MSDSLIETLNKDKNKLVKPITKPMYCSPILLPPFFLFISFFLSCVKPNFI